jgi:hypothetical protein
MEYLRGGHLAFEKGSEPVAAYIYTIEAGDIYFGLVRKLYEDGRKIIPRKSPQTGYISTGAAGTQEKYWGKWTSIGGNRDVSLHNLNAIIEELNHETNATVFKSSSVDLSQVGIQNKSGANILKCKFINKINGVIICILKMESNTFFNIFPKAGRTTPEILYSSEGERDAVKSFTIKELFEFQTNAISKKNNNFLISYFVKNLYEVILPKIAPTSEYIQKFTNLYVHDRVSRTPWELTHEPYVRDQTGKYNIEGGCIIS